MDATPDELWQQAVEHRYYVAVRWDAKGGGYEDLAALLDCDVETALGCAMYRAPQGRKGARY